jgi:GNAT superfamily N-acetyltransferase
MRIGSPSALHQCTRAYDDGMIHILRKGEFEVSTEAARLDLNLIHSFLCRSYWASDIPFEIVERSIRNSIPFGAYYDARQIGFARVISDRATYGYVTDVFVLETFRGKGVGSLLMRAIVSHPELQGLRRWSLLTRDAHGLYRQVGFTEPKNPERYMEVSNPDIYKTLKSSG